MLALLGGDLLLDLRLHSDSRLLRSFFLWLSNLWRGCCLRFLLLTRVYNPTAAGGASNSTLALGNRLFLILSLYTLIAGRSFHRCRALLLADRTIAGVGVETAADSATTGKSLMT